MYCPECDSDLTSRDGLYACEMCGREWGNALAVFGAKHARITKQIKEMPITNRIETAMFLQALTALEAAYTEIIDEMTSSQERMRWTM